MAFIRTFLLYSPESAGDNAFQMSVKQPGGRIAIRTWDERLFCILLLSAYLSENKTHHYIYSLYYEQSI
jgi:hypothetical protein